MPVAMPVDREYERAVIKEARRESGGWSCLREDGWTLWVVDNGIEPEPGDVMRCYGRGIGYPVRGIAIEGKGIVRYETEEESRASHARMVEELNAKRRAEFETKKADYDLRIRELPLPFRQRIEGFQNARPDWRWQHEGYELFVCEEAVKFARHFEGENAIWRLNEWAAKPWEEQNKEVAVDGGHSGNTFGAAVSLARTFLLGDTAAVTRQHGALCPLVGCEDYGCSPARSRPPRWDARTGGEVMPDNDQPAACWCGHDYERHVRIAEDSTPECQDCPSTSWQESTEWHEPAPSAAPSPSTVDEATARFFRALFGDEYDGSEEWDEHHDALNVLLAVVRREEQLASEFKSDERGALTARALSAEAALASALTRAARLDETLTGVQRERTETEIALRETRARAEQAEVELARSQHRAADFWLQVQDANDDKREAEAQYAVAEAARVDSAALIQRVMKIVGDADGSGIETDEELLEALRRVEARVQYKRSRQ